MIERTKCRNCGQAYEIIWSDSDVDDWRDDFDDGVENEDSYDDENSDPVYCPFCGNHCDYSEQ